MEFTDFIVRWHAGEMTLQNGINIIDFNLLRHPIPNKGFASRSEALEVLDTVEVEDEFLRAKLVSCREVLCALLGRGAPFHNYLEHTVGLSPYLIPDKELRVVQLQMRELQSSLYSSQDLTRVEECQERSAPSSKNDFIRLFQKIEGEQKELFSSAFEIPDDLTYVTEFVEEDAYWGMWVDTNEAHQFRLRINLRQGSPIGQGAIEMLIWHEILAHFVQAHNIRLRYQDARCLTTVFGPEQFLFEGLAQTLPLFISNSLSEFGQLALRISQMKAYVFSNATLRYMQNEEISDIIEEVKSWAPFLDEPLIRKRLEQASKSVVLQPYFWVYGPAAYEFSQFAANSKEGKKDVLNSIYHNILAPSQVRAILT